MTLNPAVIGALVLGVAAWMWRQQWAAQPASGALGGAGKVAFGRSNRDTIALATAAGILLAKPIAGSVVEATAWLAGTTGLDAAAWAPAGADVVVLVLAAAAVVDIVVIGLWRSAMNRPALRHSLIGLALPALLVAGVPLVAQTSTDAVDAIGHVPPAAACAPPTPTPPNPGREIAGYGPQQLANAATIVQVGQEMGVPARGQVMAVAGAMQESALVNLHSGDRDSLGLFQQRPSQGWGTPAQVTDPRYAARKFYAGLQRVPHWTDLPLWQAVQAVQRSGFPTAYAKHETAAAQVVGAVAHTPCPRS